MEPVSQVTLAILRWRTSGVLVWTQGGFKSMWPAEAVLRERPVVVLVPTYLFLRESHLLSFLHSLVFHNSQGVEPPREAKVAYFPEDRASICILLA